MFSKVAIHSSNSDSASILVKAALQCACPKFSLDNSCRSCRKLVAPASKPTGTHFLAREGFRRCETAVTAWPKESRQTYILGTRYRCVRHNSHDLHLPALFPPTVDCITGKWSPLPAALTKPCYDMARQGIAVQCIGEQTAFTV